MKWLHGSSASVSKTPGRRPYGYKPKAAHKSELTSALTTWTCLLTYKQRFQPTIYGLSFVGTKSSITTIVAARTSSTFYEKHESYRLLYKVKNLAICPGRVRAQEATKVECHDYSSCADLICFLQEARVRPTTL
ncbi:hypothetical protein PS1_030773 [Malus domestica]